MNKNMGGVHLPRQLHGSYNLYKDFIKAKTKEDLKEAINDRIYALDKLTHNSHKRTPPDSKICKGGMSNG